MNNERLSKAVCLLNRAREECYTAMPDGSTPAKVQDVGRMVAREVMHVLNRSTEGWKEIEKAGLLMVLADEFTFGLQEKLRAL